MAPELFRGENVSVSVSVCVCVCGCGCVCVCVCVCLCTCICVCLPKFSCRFTRSSVIFFNKNGIFLGSQSFPRVSRKLKFWNYLTCQTLSRNSQSSSLYSFYIIYLVSSWLLRMFACSLGFLTNRDTQRQGMLQYTATHCNALQHTATHCNTLQHTATHAGEACSLPSDA